jgi:ribonuclease BN (tRNA processing enzyme)
MELLVLGSAPAYTNRAGSAASSYLLRAGDAALLLDLGHGAYANLAAAMEPSALTGVVVSHLHPDHFVDLVPLRHYLKWEFVPPRHVRVFGPAGLAGRLDGLHGEPGFTAASLDVEDLAEGVRRIGPFEIEVRRVTHTEESYAFRVVVAAGASGGDAGGGGGAGRGGGVGAKGAGLVYSGDCGRAEDLLPLIRPGDTLLSEASFGAGPVAEGAGHITAADAARVASTAGAARLLLTHVLSGRFRADALAAAEAAFGGPIQLVTEGDRFEV